MNDLLPLLAGTPDELEALLLRAAESDEPPDGALERVGAHIGVGAAALAAASANSVLSTGAAASTGSAFAGASAARHLTWASLAKWLAAGLGSGLIASGAVHLATRSAEHASSTVVHVSAPSAPATSANGAARVVEPEPKRSVPGAVPPSEATAAVSSATPVGDARRAPNAAPAGNMPAYGVTPSPSPNPSPNAPARGLLPAASSASFAPLEEAHRVTPAPHLEVTPAASTLGDETKALDHVRERIASARPSEALAALERYRARWPHGALTAEASLLRVDALLRTGRRAEAELEANALSARAPQSRYATRARALLDAAR